MREKDRITRICSLLEKLWNTYPDQRFHQLLYNYITPIPGGDNFFVEDDIVEEMLYDKLEGLYSNGEG